MTEKWRDVEVKIARDQETEYYYITVDGKRSDRVKEKEYDMAFAAAMDITQRHNTQICVTISSKCGR